MTITRGGPSTEDPRLKDQGSAGEIPEGAAVGVDLQEEAEKASKTIIEAIADLFRKVATPQPKTVDLSDEEEAEHLPPISAQILSDTIKTLLVSRPNRVVVAPSDSISSGGGELATDRARQIIGFQADRLRLTIRNHDAANPIFVSGRADLSSTSFGFQIPAGEEKTIETRGEVWGIAETATVAYSFLVEFRSQGEDYPA